MLITPKCIELHRYLTCAITFRQCYEDPSLNLTGTASVPLLPPCTTVCQKFSDECKFTNYGEDCTALYVLGSGCILTSIRFGRSLRSIAKLHQRPSA